MVTRGESRVLGEKRKYGKYFEEEQEDNTELLPGLPNYAAVQLISTRLPWQTFHVLSSVSRAWLGTIRSGEIDDTELLPGLPNYVTVQFISTKLPWRTFHVLSSVSRAWLGAVRSGEINYTRVRSRTAETLAVINIIDSSIQDRHRGNEIALYSLRDKAFYRLPPLPRFEYGIPAGCSYIATGGKIYMLGGALDAEVWVLDVAGQQKWQECASMQTPRSLFGSAVFHGKIYIFGGENVCRQPIDSSEVYDPKVDAWSKISPMKSATLSHDAGVVGDEVFVYGGYVYDPDYYHGDKRPIETSRDGMEAYNPVKDSWRTIPPGDFGKHEFGTNSWRLRRLGSFGKHDIRTKGEKLFTAHGRLHSYTQRKIVVFDLDKKSVKCVHPCSVRTRPNMCLQGSFWPQGVLATDDGLLTIGQFEDNRLYELYQSCTGEFGMGKKKIVLEEVTRSPLVTVAPLSFVRPIQL